MQKSFHHVYLPWGQCWHTRKETDIDLGYITKTGADWKSELQEGVGLSALFSETEVGMSLL